mmetsp:Transcript_13209/g.26030  ORF Transcript_13209/g.26030 Transcript_13209/m.26030 type:complete len:109 (-) Transcript_13209:617-943(-)
MEKKREAFYTETVLNSWVGVVCRVSSINQSMSQSSELGRKHAVRQSVRERINQRQREQLHTCAELRNADRGKEFSKWRVRNYDWKGRRGVMRVPALFFCEFFVHLFRS